MLYLVLLLLSFIVFRALVYLFSDNVLSLLCFISRPHKTEGILAGGVSSIPFSFPFYLSSFRDARERATRRGVDIRLATLDLRHVQQENCPLGTPRLAPPRPPPHPTPASQGEEEAERPTLSDG